jgi:phosphoribosylformylglycinamidine synthase
VVYAPGTVIISASGEVTDVKKVVEPVVINDPSKSLYYLNLSSVSPALGGSAFAQVISKIGKEAPTVADPAYFVKAFNTIQELIEEALSSPVTMCASGGLITTPPRNVFQQYPWRFGSGSDRIRRRGIR